MVGLEPPYHAELVLTHRAREPIEMEGGASFRFVTQGFEAAYAQARETAGEDGIDIAGGASTVRQALAAGVIDELALNIIPSCSGPASGCFDRRVPRVRAGRGAPLSARHAHPLPADGVRSHLGAMGARGTPADSSTWFDSAAVREIRRRGGIDAPSGGGSEKRIGPPIGFT